ncbi:chitooligosaccharidolytic beta-N-acetylglucosaminidase-like [Homarus americanus]|uniref:Beta-hexosaminidase n=1 Tax=Homarus americanus TaxID=6706 RepID=A0A8J5K687_HOMAM|nr:chitooligosaccharidolytic beta-N-acetylglucosaminidase-like [Homarus americanus]KAG7167815.1 Chitooligosaccharidolytic beta-N-acetylglucosaminidase-like 1 [Homarus americanus]
MRGSFACGVAPLLLTLILAPAATTTFFSLPSPWGYRCDVGRCIKEDNTGVEDLVTLNTCKLTCGPFGVLWPQPKSATVGKEVVQFLPSNITHKTSCAPAVCELLEQAVVIFKDNLQRYHPDYAAGLTPWKGPWGPATVGHTLNLDVTVNTDATRLSLETDESYSLSVSTTGQTTTAIIITATYFGARHALETLSQLVEYQEYQDSLMIVSTAEVSDSPVFKYRGLILDTSRNFIGVEAIERTLDTMAANKLNSFHWHITDSHSFPLYLESLPKMSYYGAYSSRHVYYPADIRHLVEYGRVRGVRVLPEFDAPAHVGNGWQWTEKEEGLGKLAVCVNREPWQSYCVEPPCGQLNLANPNMYKLLGQIYDEMVQLFSPLDLFHYGGDEVNLNCWNTTAEIVAWMTENNNGLDADAYYVQWGTFQERARQLLTTANGEKEVTGILWTSHLTEAGHVDRFLNNSQYIIQIWTTGDDPVIGELLKKNYRVIFSTYDSWYLDCGMGAWVGEGNNWCSPYKGWQKVYDFSPYEIAINQTGADQRDLIMGGEAALWTEQVDDTAVDSKLWPRGAALAERLWTNPSANWKPAETRFIHNRQRLVKRGVMAERIQPEWCHQNEGLCYL